MAVRGINKVILVGRLGKAPEVRYIPNGGAVANLQVATSETRLRTSPILTSQRSVSATSCR